MADSSGHKAGWYARRVGRCQAVRSSNDPRGSVCPGAGAAGAAGLNGAKGGAAGPRIAGAGGVTGPRLGTAVKAARETGAIIAAEDTARR